MKKSGVLRFVLTLAIVALFSVTLVACGENGSGGGNGGGSGGGSGSGGGGSENPTDPVLNGINTYFDGARVVYGNGYLKDENNSDKLFTDLLDRQFDVLAEDILYRLQIVYGEGTYGPTSDFKDLALNGGNYSNNGNAAKVIKNNLVTKNSEHVGKHTPYNDSVRQNLDCPTCYQDIIRTGLTLELSNRRIIKFEGAINGQYTILSDIYNDLSHNYNAAKQWVVTDLTNTAVKNQIKFEIAKIVAGSTSSDYDTLLSNIKTLGFDKTEGSKKLVGVVNNNIIGANLISENLEIHNSFTAEEKYTITTKLDKSKKLFKGYNIVVPAIVDMALSNTFENTSTSLYPVAGKESSEILNFGQTTNTKNYSAMYLMQKNESIKPTKMNIKVRSDSASAGKTIKIYATVKKGDVAIKERFLVATINLTFEGEEVSVTLDTAALGKYNGIKGSFGSESMFGNSAAMPDELTLCGASYIKFDFENTANASFGIDFLGMFDKMK